jgi:hypothetical protein
MTYKGEVTPQDETKPAAKSAAWREKIVIVRSNGVATRNY